MLKLIDTKGPGMKFLRENLLSGDYLAKGLMKTAGRAGFVYTYVPENVDFGKISLENGGLDNFEHGCDLLEPLVRLAQEYLSNARNVIISEIPNVLNSQPLSELLAYSYFRSAIVRSSLQGGMVIGSEETKKWSTVYGFLNYIDQSREKIKELIDIAGNVIISLTVLTSVQEMGVSLQHGQDIASEVITDLGERADYAYVRAYDGESHIIWSRSPLTEE